MKHKRQKLGWLIVGMVVVLLIVGPFILFGAQIEAWTASFVDSAREQPWVSGLVLGGLLAGDIFLPVPSSIVSTACGVVHGFVGGALVSALGMTLSCLLGYGVARSMGRPIVLRCVGDRELTRLQQWEERYGLWIVVVARPIPVLAEASILFLGLGAMPFMHFMVLTALSNVAISLVYAAAGAWSAGIQSFLPALAASVLVPWVLMRMSGAGRSPEPETQ